MIGPCQEGKTSPDALGRSAGANSLGFFVAPLGLSAVVPIRIEPDFHLLSQPKRLLRRLSWCFPTSLETTQRERRELAFSRSVRYRQDLAGCASKNLFVLALCDGALIDLRRLKITLSAIDGHQICDQFPCHG